MTDRIYSDEYWRAFWDRVLSVSGTLNINALDPFDPVHAHDEGDHLCFEKHPRWTSDARRNCAEIAKDAWIKMGPID